jgi:ferredoxin
MLCYPGHTLSELAAASAEMRSEDLKMPTVNVDWNRCEGHGLCAEAAPEVFHLDDDGELHVMVEDVPEESVRQVETAVGRCPLAALNLTR